MAASERDGWPLLIVVAALGTAIAILFATSRPPALGDFAEWTYHGVLLRDLLSGSPAPAYVLKHYPVPNTLTTLGLGLLMLVLPWLIAAKLWLALQLVAVSAGAWFLSRAAQSSRWSVVVVTAGATLGIAFWAGFSNFLLGCCCVMVLAGQMLRRQTHMVPLALLLLLAFVCHMIPFAFAVALLVLYARQRGRPLLMLAAVPGALASVWYFAGRALNGDADGQAGMVSSVPYASFSFLLFKGNTFAKCWGLINPALAEHDSVLQAKVGVPLQAVLLLCEFLIAAFAATLLFQGAQRAIRSKREDRFFWIAALAFFVLGLLLPGALGGVSDPGGRVTQMTAWCGILFVGHSDRYRWTMRAAAACALPLLAANLFLLSTVAMQPPQRGALTGPLPGTLRQFAHIYYADRYADYEALRANTRDQPIYPTALFLRRDQIQK